MEKLIEILTNILASIQVICNGVLSLLFQPLFYLISIIQGIIDVWSEEEENEDVEQQQVMQYPSTNVGRYAEEVEYPTCEHKIGYKINRTEQDEIKRIKDELNQ